MSRLSRDPIFPPSPPPLPLQPAIAVAPPSRHLFALPALLKVLWFIFLALHQRGPLLFLPAKPGCFFGKTL